MSRCSSVDDVQLLQGWPPVAGPSGGARRAQLRELQMAARMLLSMEPAGPVVARADRRRHGACPASVIPMVAGADEPVQARSAHPPVRYRCRLGMIASSAMTTVRPGRLRPRSPRLV